MSYHHLLPFLALILLILPSSSHADNQIQALFSDTNIFLVGGKNLTHGVYTLSLQNDCSLRYYENGKLYKDYLTTIKDATFCQLSINRRGQLLLTTGDEQNSRYLGTPGKPKEEYALVFTNKGLCVYGPRIWDSNEDKYLNVQTLKNKNLRETTSSNVLYSTNATSPENAINGDIPIATNKNASVYITPYCALSVNNTETKEIIWNPNSGSAEPRNCSLYLTENGVLSLLSKDSEELHTHWTGGDLQDVNDYVLVLRYYGGLDIYGFKINVRDIHPYPGTVAENIKMVAA